jgi:hypothetical protein
MNRRGDVILLPVVAVLLISFLGLYFLKQAHNHHKDTAPVDTHEKR